MESKWVCENEGKIGFLGVKSKRVCEIRNVGLMGILLVVVESEREEECDYM